MIALEVLSANGASRTWRQGGFGTIRIGCLARGERGEGFPWHVTAFDGIALGLAGLALIPPLLWIGVVLVAPTAWARRHVVAALEASSGRSVALAGVSVPLLGGVELKGLAFGSPKSTDDPWLKAKNLRLDISVCQLVLGKFEPCSIEVEGSDAARAAAGGRQPRAGRFHRATTAREELAAH